MANLNSRNHTSNKASPSLVVFVFAHYDFCNYNYVRFRIHLTLYCNFELFWKRHSWCHCANSARTYSFMYGDVFNSSQMKCKSKNRDENDEKKVSVKTAWYIYIWAVLYLGDLYVWTNEWSPMIHAFPYTINICTVCTESKRDSDAYSRVLVQFHHSLGVCVCVA